MVPMLVLLVEVVTSMVFFDFEGTSNFGAARAASWAASLAASFLS